MAAKTGKGKACTGCGRDEVVTVTGRARPIALDRAGVCQACREAATEAAADDAERQARAGVKFGKVAAFVARHDIAQDRLGGEEPTLAQVRAVVLDAAAVERVVRIWADDAAMRMVDGGELDVDVYAALQRLVK